MDTLNVDIQGVHLLCGDFNAHNQACDTIVKHDNIGNYIAQWSYNNKLHDCERCVKTYFLILKKT